MGPCGAARAPGVPRIQTALWLLRGLSKISSEWKLKGGCSFFPQNMLLTPFFLSSSISQSFYSPTFLPFFYSPLISEEAT